MEDFVPLDRRKSLGRSGPRSNFFSRTVAIRKASDGGVGDLRGPLGLTTVYKPLGNAIADLIFVHGLGGGSRKTWTKDDNPAHFWPQEWLSQDEEFGDVRIHMFGYDSNWEKGSILNIHDFAKSLLEWVTNCPDIPRDANRPVVLVCHSMGGLVVKRAFILARQLREYEKFSKLVKAMFFLATPHRGSNLAEILSKILQMTPGVRPFVSDLHPSSISIESINEEFPHHCQDLQLFSFYETIPMSFGVKKSLVVPKESAILGYSNERSMYLDAHHRDVCKFTSSDEPNYRLVRGALAATLAEIRGKTGLKRRETSYEQQQWLNDSLEVSDSPEDEFLRVDALRLRGSCEWVAVKPAFQAWRDRGHSEIYWVTAAPGSGKSVLCGYVIKVLREMGQDCAFYFFAYGDRAKSSISAFLRSMAWQLASTNPQLFDKLSKICRRDPHIAQADYRIVWRKLFLEAVFGCRPDRPQYWVIDALDECKSDGELVPYLLQIAAAGFIQIFITSRSTFKSYGITPTAVPIIKSDQVSPETTKADIELYLKGNIHNLPALGHDKGEARAAILRLLLEKSCGCFLWVRLVLQELRHVSTRAGIQQVLEDIPSDMDNIYIRILDSIASRTREQQLVRAILDWTACSARPLSTNELYHALRLDIDDDIDDDVKRFIDSNCGQLVLVDTSFRVRTIHQTARDFLFSDKNTSEIKLNRKTVHKRLAIICLKYLCGPEMAGPKTRKLSASQIQVDRCALVSYASNSLFEHLMLAPSDDDELMSAITQFLRSTNVLAWIEYVAKEGDLGRMIQTGRALKNFQQRRKKHILPLGNAARDNELLDAWATDLLRLVTKFGLHLRTSPSSIFNLIPPFCPSDTALRTQFAGSNRAITVSGLSNRIWDDCSSTIVYQQDSTSALACSVGMFAVGLQSGRIVIYNETTCQEVRALIHGEPVKKLLFGDTGLILAAAGLKTISIWDVSTWSCHWILMLRSQFSSLAFTEKDQLLLGAFRNNELMVWNMATGMEQTPFSWLEDDEEDYSAHFRRPITTAISGDQTLLAVVYRGQDIIVWDIDGNCVYDIYGKHEGSLGGRAEKRKGMSSVWSMIFSRAPEAKLLVAGYNDGGLVLFNVAEGTVQGKATANAHTIASSPDGLTLACGDSAGSIQIFEFDSLKLLYRVQAEEVNIKYLAFSADSQRLLNIQGRRCRVWDPPVLVRQEFDEENSDTVSVSTMPQEYKLDETPDTVPITALACAENGEAIFCGKQNGTICLYDPRTGQKLRELIRHTFNVPIVLVHFDTSSSTLVSVDSSSRIMVHRLIRQRTDWQVGVELLDYRAGIAVSQVLTNAGCTRLLISTAEFDILWAFEPTKRAEIARLHWTDRKRFQWCTHSLDLSQVMLIENTVAYLYDWQSLTSLTSTKGIALEGSVLRELAIRGVQPCFNHQFLATTFADSASPTRRSQSKLMLWNAVQFTPQADHVAPVPHFQPLADHVECLLGAFGQRLVFLHQDGWICSADTHSFDEEYYDRHFFFPPDWLSSTASGGSGGGANLMLAVLRGGVIVFVQHHELAVIKRGLEYFEHGQSRGPGKRPSLSHSAVSDPFMETVARTMSAPFRR